LRIQDIVLTADDRRIETLPQLSSALYLHRLDKLLKLEILRGDEKITLYVPAIEHRDEMDQLFDAADPEKSLISRLGILATDLTDDLRSKIGTLRIPSGVVVLGRAADLILPDTGLETGDIIHALNTTPIASMDGLRAAFLPLKAGDPVVLQVERSDGLTYLSFEME
ncbi:MAG: PDZ domain-containing protein, partial [Candidatus Sulfotelmatobacter sp.]